MTISPFAAREGTSAPQWPKRKKCCHHLVPSSDFFVQSYAVPNSSLSAPACASEVPLDDWHWFQNLLEGEGAPEQGP